MSYIDSSRGICLGCWSKDVYHRRVCDCLWHSSQCSLRVDLLGDNIVLTVKPDSQRYPVLVIPEKETNIGSVFNALVNEKE